MNQEKVYKRLGKGCESEARLPNNPGKGQAPEEDGSIPKPYYRPLSSCLEKGVRVTHLKVRGPEDSPAWWQKKHGLS